MPRVICELPNASELISGVKFTKLDDGRMLSAEIDEETANRFATVSGYYIDLEDLCDDNETEQEALEPAAPKLSKAQQAKADKEAKAKAKEEADAAEALAAKDDQDAPAVDAAAELDEGPADELESFF